MTTGRTGWDAGDVARRTLILAAVAAPAIAATPLAATAMEPEPMNINDVDAWRALVETYMRELVNSPDEDLQIRIRQSYNTARRLSDGLGTSQVITMAGIAGQLAVALGISHSHMGELAAADVHYRAGLAHTAIYPSLYQLHLALAGRVLSRASWEGAPTNLVVRRADELIVRARGLDSAPAVEAHAAITHALGEADDQARGVEAIRAAEYMSRAADRTQDPHAQMRGAHARLYAASLYGTHAQASQVYAELRPIVAGRAVTTASVEVEYATAEARAGHTDVAIDRAYEALRAMGQPPVMVLRREVQRLTVEIKRRNPRKVSPRLESLRMHATV